MKNLLYYHKAKLTIIQTFHKFNLPILPQPMRLLFSFGIKKSLKSKDLLNKLEARQKHELHLLIIQNLKVNESLSLILSRK